MKLQTPTLPAMRLAYLRVTGPYGSPAIKQAWYRFGAWARQNGKHAPRAITYGIAQDDAMTTAPERCRYDCCVEVKPGFEPREDIGVQDFPGGRYAVVQFTGTSAQIGAAWQHLYGQLVPASGLKLAKAPGVEVYENDFVVDSATGTFKCWLCVPVEG